MLEQLPSISPDQVKDSIANGQVAWEAVKKFIDSLAWIIPWVTFFAAHGSAWIKAINNNWLLRLIAGNYGFASNK